MPITNIFSKRQKALRGEVPDVYSYDSFPGQLKVQIVHIMHNTLGSESQYEGGGSFPYSYPLVRKIYNQVVDILCREYGVFRLPANYKGHQSKVLDLINFFLQEKDIERALDVVELSFSSIDRFTRNSRYLNKRNPSDVADSAIEELNGRFKEHGVGYCFTDGQIVRIDSEFIHAEVVQPALGILNQREYAGARQEFLQAHEHYRAGNTKEALNECLKSLESVMKSICDKRGWDYGDKATAHTLIGICFDKQLIPSFWETQFSALRSLLESGVPPARNRLSGHGQGAEVKPVPDFTAGYVLHMTAAAIVFLAQAEASGGGA